MGCSSSSSQVTADPAELAKLPSSKPTMPDVSALIVVDVQNDFCSGGTLAVPENEAIFPVIEKLRKDAEYKAKFNHVIFTRDWHPYNHCSFQSNNPGSSMYKPITLANGKE